MHAEGMPSEPDAREALILTDAAVHRCAAGMVELHAQPTTACGSCAQQGSCGFGSLTSRQVARLSLLLPVAVNLREGDTVAVSIAAPELLRAAVACNLIPAATMLAGCLLASYFKAGDLAAFVGAALGLAVGSWLLKLYDARVSATPGRVRIRPDASKPHVRVALTKPG
jgi:positive regulator of sigma E activity